MTLAAIVLIIISAVLHACWNFLGKRGSPSPEFFLTANTIGCLCLAPALITHMGVLGQLSGTVWILLAITGLFQAIYYTGLAGAYKAGHLSVAYPLARSIPVVMVPVVSFLAGRGSQLSTQSICGMALITVGSLILPVRRIRDWTVKDYLAASSLFALAAAAGTTGYSIIDDSALRLLVKAKIPNVGRVPLALIYALLEGISSSLWQAIFVLIKRSRQTGSPKHAQFKIGSAALAGVGIYLAYGLVLLAMTYARNVSFIVAFRQLSIPLGAMLGIVVLKEPRYPAKLVGTLIMVAGLVMVAAS